MSDFATPNFVCCLLVNIAPTSPVNRVNPRFLAPNYKINVYGAIFAQLQKLGVRVVIRDSLGQLEAAFTLCLVVDREREEKGKERGKGE